MHFKMHLKAQGGDVKMELFLTLLKAFAVGGLICVVGQLLIDLTKLTPAKVLVLFVVAVALTPMLRQQPQSRPRLRPQLRPQLNLNNHKTTA